MAHVKITFVIECDEFDDNYNNIDELAEHFGEYLEKVGARILPETFTYTRVK